MIDPSSPEFWPELFRVLLAGTGETLYMVGVALVFTVLLGLPLGIVLVGTESGGVLERPFGSRSLGIWVNRVADFIVNLGRAVPFVILMVAMIPLTRLIVGTSIGSTAAIVPLAAVAVPFFARMVEIAIKEVDGGLIEAAESLGATRWQIVTKVLIPEALAPMMLGLSTTITSIINFSAMVGVVAGGGLGSVALRYGYQRYSVIHMITVIIIIFIIVMILQTIATRFAKRFAHRSSSDGNGANSRTSVRDKLEAEAVVQNPAPSNRK